MIISARPTSIRHGSAPWRGMMEVLVELVDFFFILDEAIIQTDTHAQKWRWAAAPIAQDISSMLS